MITHSVTGKIRGCSVGSDIHRLVQCLELESRSDKGHDRHQPLSRIPTRE